MIETGSSTLERLAGTETVKVLSSCSPVSVFFKGLVEYYIHTCVTT
jgi:hypothetical protein